MKERRNKDRPKIKGFARDKKKIVAVAVRGLKRRIISDVRNGWVRV